LKDRTKKSKKKPGGSVPKAHKKNHPDGGGKKATAAADRRGDGSRFTANQTKKRLWDQRLNQYFPRIPQTLKSYNPWPPMKTQRAQAWLKRADGVGGALNRLKNPKKGAAEVKKTGEEQGKIPRDTTTAQRTSRHEKGGKQLKPTRRNKVRTSRTAGAKIQSRPAKRHADERENQAHGRETGKKKKRVQTAKKLSVVGAQQAWLASGRSKNQAGHKS